jgi:uncharacterized protein YceH (UPF0502 family)
MACMSDPIRLNGHEARVLGVLIEKELTTPDGYPLSINAVVLGSNQKSNRDPQTDYSEAEVVVALTGLMTKHLAGRSMPAGSRVEKYRHSAREGLGLSTAETAVLAELLMRGPQQPGELRTRASRMSPLSSQDELMGLLDSLAQKGLARNLGRRPGERVERWGQTLAPEAHPVEAAGTSDAGPARVPAPIATSVPAAPDLTQRVADLEQRVARLENTLAELGG